MTGLFIRLFLDEDVDVLLVNSRMPPVKAGRC